MTSSEWKNLVVFTHDFVKNEKNLSIKDEKVRDISDKLPRADLDILNTLQSDCRMTLAELSEQVNLSQTPCWRRWKKLENDGYIAGYNAVLDRKKLGLSVIGFSQIRLNSHHPEDTTKFELAIKEFDWVLLCFCITGEADFIVQIIAKDLDQYYERVSELRRLPYVWSIQSSIAIKEVKSTHQIPVRS
ncbi:Lrp/AsnC family transcriptional regulator [Photobacterium nomapromontoriensis]|uniref:Lrp/AsnC family transcriptional regulator n=1 Tax=Photobacterium nomapromontoriensis TaxID=2910237 RepID=UPI003D149284